MVFVVKYDLRHEARLVSAGNRPGMTIKIYIMEFFT
jgi:hypothetical protein